ncbi:unnamed protein product [Urochloa humidicola]
MPSPAPPASCGAHVSNPSLSVAVHLPSSSSSLPSVPAFPGAPRPVAAGEQRIRTPRAHGGDKGGGRAPLAVAHPAGRLPLRGEASTTVARARSTAAAHSRSSRRRRLPPRPAQRAKAGRAKAHARWPPPRLALVARGRPR